MVNDPTFSSEALANYSGTQTDDLPVEQAIPRDSWTGMFVDGHEIQTSINLDENSRVSVPWVL